jgi:hypothetical protein
MANKKLSPQDAESGQVRNTRTGARRPNTQRPTDKSMTLYTMSGKRTTIAERDNTSEEERMAEIRARLFTLFDEGEAKEREYAEQSKLKNRATGAFMKIRDIIGEGEEGYGAGSAYEDEAPRPVKNSADGREDSGARPGRTDFETRSGQTAAEARRAARSAQIERQPERSPREHEEARPAQTDRGQKRSSREEARPAQTDKGQKRSSREEARPAQTDRGQRRSPREEAREPKRERVEQERRVKPVNPVRAMGAEKLGRRGLPEMADEREAVRARGAAESLAPGRARREAVRAGAGKPAAPGRVKPVAARAEAEKPAAVERVRPVAARAEAERPAVVERVDTQQEMDASFRLGDLFKDKEPDIFSRWEREDEEEKRIRERRERRRAEAAKRVRGEDDGSRMKTAAALFIAREGMRNFFGKISGSRAPGDEHEAEERETGSEPRESMKRESAVGAAPGPEGGAAERAAVKSGTDGEQKEYSRKRRAADLAGVSVTEDDAREEQTAGADSEHEGFSFFDFFRRPERPSRTMAAWITGWAAGAAAVVVIALIIVNNHVAGL